jgi:hypothetical protein
MKLTRAAGSIIAEYSGASLYRHVTELENDKDVLQRTVEHGIEDYDLLVIGNRSLLFEHVELKSRCEGLYRLSWRRLFLTPRRELPFLR